MARFSNHSIELKKPVAQVIPGLGSAALELGTAIEVPDTGDPFTEFMSIIGQEPSLPFGTHDLETVIGNFGIDGVCVKDADSEYFRLNFQGHDACSTQGRSGGGYFEFTDAMGYIENISIPSRGAATLTGRIYGVSPDGSNPVVSSFAASAPDLPNDYVAFTLGQPTVAGVDLDYITQIDIAFANDLEIPQYGGSIWPKLVDFKRTDITITLSTDEVDLFTHSITPVADKFRQTGEAALHSNTTLRMLRLKDGESTYPLTDSEHILATTHGTVHLPTPYRAAGTGVATSVMEIKSSYDRSGRS